MRQITNADDYDKSAALYDAKVKDANGNDTDVPLFPASGWTGKVVGNLWLIRPDERPVDAP